MSVVLLPPTAHGSRACVLVPPASEGHAGAQKAGAWKKSLEGSGNTVVRGGMSAAEKENVDHVVMYSPNVVSEEKCDEIFQALAKGGHLNVLTMTGQEETEMNLTFAGFIVKNHSNESDLHMIFATKPEWRNGECEALPPAPTTIADKTKLWEKIAGDYDGDGDLENEDDLLSMSDVKATRDCGTGAGKKRRACKNCSCGLREELEAESKGLKPSGAQTTPQKSACGNVSCIKLCVPWNHSV